jgi:hypothetical protein
LTKSEAKKERKKKRKTKRQIVEPTQPTQRYQYNQHNQRISISIKLMGNQTSKCVHAEWAIADSTATAGAKQELLVPGRDGDDQSGRVADISSNAMLREGVRDGGIHGRLQAVSDSGSMMDGKSVLQHPERLHGLRRNEWKLGGRQSEASGSIEHPSRQGQLPSGNDGGMAECGGRLSGTAHANATAAPGSHYLEEANSVGDRRRKIWTANLSRRSLSQVPAQVFSTPNVNFLDVSHNSQEFRLIFRFTRNCC